MTDEKKLLQRVVSRLENEFYKYGPSACVFYGLTFEPHLMDKRASN
jgi:hypothetical protein